MPRSRPGRQPHSCTRRRTIRGHREAGWHWCRRVTRSSNRSALNVPVAGSYTSAAVPQPPASSTRPSASRVADSPSGPPSLVACEPVQAKPGDRAGVGRRLSASAPAVRPRPRSPASTAGARWPRRPAVARSDGSIGSLLGGADHVVRHEARRVRAIGVHRPPAHRAAASWRRSSPGRRGSVRPAPARRGRDPVGGQATHIGPVRPDRVDDPAAPRRGDSNRIRAPSGDHSGIRRRASSGSPGAGSGHRHRPARPRSASVRPDRRRPPSPNRKKTIRFPSGDQPGADVPSQPVDVSSTTRPVARSIVAIDRGTRVPDPHRWTPG